MNSIADDTENSENVIIKEKTDDTMVNTELMTQIENQEEDEINESSMERSTKINETPAAEKIEREVIIDASIKLDHQRLVLTEPNEYGSVELQEEIEMEVTKRTKRILDDSDDEDNIESSDKINGHHSLASPLSPKINVSHVETESEDVAITKLLSSVNNTNHNDEDSDDEGNFSMVRKNKTKLKALIDSDSEDESQTKISSVEASNSGLETESKTEFPIIKNAKSKFNGLIDSDTEDETNDEKTTTSPTIKPKKQKQLKHKSSKISSLVDSESDSDADSNHSQQEEPQLSEEEIMQHENEQHEEDNKKHPKQMRASAKKAMDEMQAIQSEQQRLHREAQISIPYHKPKRHTLQEFLKRRTIQQPLQRNSGSPTGVTKALKSLKMTAEELAEYAKLMEARAKEATEFFKSESEDDEPKNDNFINDTTDLDNNESIKPVEAESASENNISEQKKEENDFNEIEMNVDQSAAPVESEGGLTIEPEIPPTQPIITEVVELPKLNINTLKVAPPTTTETVYKLIHDKKLTDSPSLKGDPNMLIDLETGDLVAKQPTGVDNLFQRFMAAKAKRKHKSTETLSILTTDNGKMEVSTVNVHIHDEQDDNKETKPGEAYFKLKENLRSIIKKKRLDELEKKKAERREEELEHQKCLDDDEEEDLLDDDEDDYDEEKLSGRKKTKCSDAILIDDEENAIDLEEDDGSDCENDEEKLDDVEADENIEESTGLNEDAGEEDEEADDNNEDDNEDGDNDDDSDDDDSDDDNANPIENEDNSKRKSRIIKAFQPDSDEEIDFLRTPTQTKISSEKLFDEEATLKPDPIKAENELLEFCSGKFEDTTQVSSIISQIPMTQANASAAAADEELLGLCSGTFEDKPEEDTQSQATVPKKILSSDDENPSNEIQPKRVKKLTKRASKNKAKLGFSDDEDDEDEQETAPVVLSADEESLDAEEEDIPQTFIDYDSEENEIVVEMTKKDCLKQAENFFEKEAELSESEWGSADEDEKHMDKYDIELGDEDEFDREKLQTELGQIHARKMLDEDIREVRKIQEMLFEDEEKDGVGRQRQFKWKNIESGFSLDDPSGENAFKHGENGESGDEENEQLWRKIRYEREQLLKEKNLKEDISVSIINSTLSSTSFGSTTMLQTSSVKKLNIISAKKIQSNAPIKKSSPFLISKSMGVLEKRPARGSFLIRDKETLSKLAGLTKGGAQNADGTAGTAAVKAIKPQNFVFATLTEEEHAILKRKSDDLLNSSAEHGINYLKRPKIEPRREKCFIDQLL